MHTSPEYIRGTNRHIGRRLAIAALSLLNVSFISGSTSPAQLNLPPETEIVAMGDSFISGHANGEVEGWDRGCLVHEVSYAHQIAELLDVQFTNVGCSGATIDDISTGRFGEPPQLDALSDQTNLVLLSTGGNIDDLTAMITQCLEGSCERASHAIEKLASPEFTERLVDVYGEIALAAPNASIIAVGYPKIIDTSTWCPTIVSTDIDYLADQFVTRLDATIETATEEARNKGIDITYSPPPRIDICSGLGKHFFTDTSNVRSLGHLTEAGQGVMAQAVLRTMMGAYEEKEAS